VVHDSFALLHQPRRPWLDEGELRETFHRLVVQEHPDVAGGDGEAFTRLNAAFATLSNPLQRVRHLLELVAPVEPAVETVSIPDDLGELFPRIASAREALLKLATRRGAASTAVARALFAREEAALRADADATRAVLAGMIAAALEDVRAVDAVWPFPTALASLRELHGRLLFLSRWDELLREAALQSELG